MYIEMDEMYRDGQLLTSRSLIGESVVYVNGRGFHKGDSVRLIPAPSFSRTEPQDVDGFYSEDRVVVAVARNQNQSLTGAYAITLDKPLTLPYFLDGQYLTSQLGDAIVSLNSSDPLYHFNDQYLGGAFGEAFVQTVKANTSGVGLPLYASMSPDDMTYAGGKWFAARESGATPSNYGLAVAAAARVPLPGTTTDVSLGTTRGSQSYVWRKTIDDLTSAPRSKSPLLSRLDPNIVSGEVLVHEVAHQWNVNPTYPNSECDKKSYADPSKWCHGPGTQNSGD